MSFPGSSLRPAPRTIFLSVLTLGLFTLNAQALDLDWQGQFQTETNTIFGSTHDTAQTSGYSVPNTGNSPANFQNLFFSLKPRVLVNDNISIHSDVWFNTPDGGWFGSNNSSGGTYHSVGASTGTLRAQNFYAELATDFGTLKVGRIPLQYGLGVVWNSENGLKSRLPSNGDALTLSAKFGSFKLTPSFIKYQQGYSTTSPTALQPNSGVTDYTLGLTYNNEDEQLELGLLFMRRLAGQSAGIVNPLSVLSETATSIPTAGYAYNLWDFYAKKKSGMFTLAAEVPLASGLVASQTYSTVAGAVKATAALNEHWNLKLNAGMANGQSGSTTNKLTAFYFHPDYRPGLLMFNYNFANLATGTGSAYDNAITNSRFFAVSGQLNSGKFSHEWLGLFGFADQTADGVNPYFNTSRGYLVSYSGGGAQSSALGFESDYSLGYEWDEYTRFGADLGLYFPGGYYNYTNSAQPNSRKAIFGTNLSMTVKF